MFLALVATALAGAATLVGGALVLHQRMRHPGPMALALAFAAGIMIVLSFVEILPHAYRSLSSHGVASPQLWVLLAFALGALAVMAIDAVVPAAPVEQTAGAEQPLAGPARHRTLLRSGLLVAVVVTAHNLPEGLASFLAMLEDPALGATLLVAIALHNIPEGAAVAAPIYAATGSRRRALTWAGLSGLAEPVGAVLGYAALRAVLPAQAIVLALALVAGMMVLISVRQLLPEARRHQTRWCETPIGFGVGAAVIWVSLQIG